MICEIEGQGPVLSPVTAEIQYLFPFEDYGSVDVYFRKIGGIRHGERVSLGEYQCRDGSVYGIFRCAALGIHLLMDRVQEVGAVVYEIEVKTVRESRLIPALFGRTVEDVHRIVRGIGTFRLFDGIVDRCVSDERTVLCFDICHH